MASTDHPPPDGAKPGERLLPPVKGSNRLNEDDIRLAKRALKKYRDKLVGEKKAWERKNEVGRGRKETNNRHIHELEEEIGQIKQVLQLS
jgi:hypothetical protein